MREEETDLSFANFGGSKRLYPAPGEIGDNQESPNPLIQRTMGLSQLSE